MLFMECTQKFIPAESKSLISWSFGQRFPHANLVLMWSLRVWDPLGVCGHAHNVIYSRRKWTWSGQLWVWNLWLE